MLSVLVDNSVIKTRADKASDKEERIEMYSFLEKGEADSKNSVSDVEPLYGQLNNPKIVHRKRDTRCVVTGICLAAVIIGVIASLGLLAYKLSRLGHGSSAERPEVVLGDSISTSNGLVLGVVEDGVHVFKGIPYAVPPVGENRWKPPVPIESKGNDVFKADNFPKKCFQLQAYINETIGSEDCLYLNIWSPSLNPDASLPVMVYIHGGGTETKIGQLYGSSLFSGSGSESGMMPDAEIAKTANMVFVSFNYRLGPFGFLAVNVTDPQSGEKITGNYGFMDQALALKWLSKNIRNFGGNPNKVTVFGVGAGATSIFALLASNKTSGLFQRAWLASPSPNFDTNLTLAFKQNQKIIDKLQEKNRPCNNATGTAMYNCLMRLSPKDIVNALPMNQWSNPHFRDLPSKNEKPVALAIIDGTFLKQPISTTWHMAQGTFKNVPLLIGSAAQEVDDWPYPTNLATWKWNNYNNYVNQRFEEFPYVTDLSTRALKLYPEDGKLTPEYQMTTMISDIRQICGVSHMSALIAHKWVAPVYRYIAAYQPFDEYSKNYTAIDTEPIRQDDPGSGSADWRSKNIVPGFRYAYHGIDVQYFFGEKDHFSPEAKKFVHNMRTAVFQFVRNGTVSGWREYPDNTNVVSSQIKYVDNQYKQQQCQLWIESSFLPHHTSMN